MKLLQIVQKWDLNRGGTLKKYVGVWATDRHKMSTRHNKSKHITEPPKLIYPDYLESSCYNLLLPLFIIFDRIEVDTLFLYII